LESGCVAYAVDVVAVAAAAAVKSVVNLPRVKYFFLLG